MDEHTSFDFDVIISSSQGTTLRRLDELRQNLYESLKLGMNPDNIEIYQGTPSRTLDPTLIATLSLAVLPIVIEKVADIIIKWVELNKGCTITVSIPVKGTQPIQMTYDPRHISPEALKKWIQLAVETSKAGK